MQTKQSLPQDEPKQGRGGARHGSGRKSREPTITKRIPVSMIPTVEHIIAHHKGELPDGFMMIKEPGNSKLSIPLMQDSVRAGFPSPAASYIANYLDFNGYLVQNQAATIAVYVKGDSMIGAGIDDGDLLVIDRSVTPQNRSIVLVDLDGEFTVKRLIRGSLGIELHPENPDFEIIRPEGESTMTLVGVVKHIIKSLD